MMPFHFPNQSMCGVSIPLYKALESVSHTRVVQRMFGPYRPGRSETLCQTARKWLGKS